jgi:N-acetylglucosaminyl-diphospho-decaprenol L-rhamnosyltransferase
MAALEIAVIIVTFRTAELTLAALRSLRSERFHAALRIHAFVIDNASGDLAAIRHALQDGEWSSWVTLLAAPRNGGFAYGNNFGIRHAFATGRPRYVYLLNPDAEVRAGAIATLVEYLEHHPAVGIAGSSFETVDGRDWPFAFRFPSLWSELCQGLQIGLITRALQRWEVAVQMPHIVRQVDWICGASMLIRPAVFNAIGGFDEAYFLYYEETDFCYRARQAGFPTCYVPDSRVMHIMGQSTSVTDNTQGPKRLPGYWFESRRRYFSKTFGVGRAAVIDVVALGAHALGLLKNIALGRGHRVVPNFIRDLARYSVLWPRNRALPPLLCPGMWTLGDPMPGATPSSSRGTPSPPVR